MLALYVVVGIALLVVVVLSIPVDVVFEFETTQRARPRIKVGWLFGLVWKRVEPRRKRPAERRRRALRPFLSILRTRGLMAGVLRLVRRMLRRLHLRRLNADVTLGLDDPADTGILWFMLWPAIAALSSLRRADVRLEPCFAGASFEVRMCGALRVFPIEMGGPLVAFVFSAPVWRAAAAVVVSRWKERRSA